LPANTDQLDGKQPRLLRGVVPRFTRLHNQISRFGFESFELEDMSVDLARVFKDQLVALAKLAVCAVVSFWMVDGWGI
jgi:hypothetical protein